MKISTYKNDTTSDVILYKLNSWNDYGFRTMWDIKLNRTNHLYRIFCLNQEENICCTRVLSLQLFFDLSDKERIDFAESFHLITEDNFEEYREFPGVICSLFRDQTSEYVQQIIKLQKYLFYSELDKYKFAIAAILSSHFLLDLIKHIDNFEKAEMLKNLMFRSMVTDGMLLDDIHNFFISIKFEKYSDVEALNIINNIPNRIQNEIKDFISSFKDITIFHLIASMPLHFLLPHD